MTSGIDVVRARKVAHDRQPASWGPAIVAIVCFFPTGLIAWARTRKSRKLILGGDISGAKVAQMKARYWMQTSVVILVSILVIGLGVALLVANDFSIIRNFINIHLIRKSFPTIAQGFWLNARLFLVAEVTVLLWSLLIAILRSLPGNAARPIRWLVICYVDLFRGLPELLVILLVVYGLNQTGLPVLSGFSDFESVILAITLVFGAYTSEVMRAAMDGVHPSQVAAARSLGLSHGQALRYVVLPQAMRSIVVPLLNGFIGLQKTTALVSIVGMLDAVNFAQAYATQDANLSALTGAAFCFVVITVPLTRVADHLMKRDSQRVFGAAR